MTATRTPDGYITCNACGFSTDEGRDYALHICKCASCGLALYEDEDTICDRCRAASNGSSAES